jgi:hypothetical protein
MLATQTAPIYVELHLTLSVESCRNSLLQVEKREWQTELPLAFSSVEVAV